MDTSKEQVEISMGDGGVACMPLQQHQHIMERFPVVEKTICGGSSNGVSSNPVKLEDTQQQQQQPPPPHVRKKKKVVKVKRVVVVKKKIVDRTEGKSGIEAKGKGELELKNSKAAENGEKLAQKEEVEEGELGTLKWPSEVENGEFEPAKLQVSEIGRLGIEGQKWKEEVEKGEIVSGMKGEVENGDCVSGRQGEVENGEIISGRKEEVEQGENVSGQKKDVKKGGILMKKWHKGDGEEKGRKVEAERGEAGTLGSSKDEVEKGEFIPDRWHKEDISKDEFSCTKSRKYESGKEKGWKYEQERTPPLGKYSNDDVYLKKDFSRSGSQHRKSSSRLESVHERTSRISSKIVDEEGLFKSDQSNGKNLGREFSSSGNRLKRHGHDFEGGERKYYGDHGDYSSSKSRKLFDDSNRASHSEHYSRRSEERFYRNSSSSRVSSMDKYSSRYHESLSSRVAYDRHGPSPGYSERSPRDRFRNYDHRDKSPGRREKSPPAHEKSPPARDRSPHSRNKSPYGHDRSPYARERSPYDRNHNYEHRNKSPINPGKSPKDRARFYDRKDRTTSYLEQSPHDRNRGNNYRDRGRRNTVSQKQNSQYCNDGQEDKLSQRDHSGRDSLSAAKEYQDNAVVQNSNGSNEKNVIGESREEKLRSPSANCNESSHVDAAPSEELQSMEEDMDICNTPPYIPVVADSSMGKWIYLDHFGDECGPSRLCDLKALVEEGILFSDHFVKHMDSDRWVTVENAASPLVTVNLSSIVSDTITQLVSPPEASGNLLVETGDPVQLGAWNGDEKQTSYLDHDTTENFLIDERVGALFEGFTVVPGRELETISEILQMTFNEAEWEEWGNSEALSWHQASTRDDCDDSDMKLKGSVECSFDVPSETLACSDSTDWFSGRWSCKGGDWMRNDEASQDRPSRRKLVLNDGFPLCQMPKSGFEDPRWHRKDDLYYPSQSIKLDLPPWAFSATEDKADCNSIGKLSQIKPAASRGVKGTMRSVVRINACVVQDHGSFVSESRTKVRGKDRYSSRSNRTHSSAYDSKRSSVESDSFSRMVNDQDLQASWKSISSVKTPKDRLCTVDDLQLHLGEWYYLDGVGHDCGPLSFSELQAMVNQGTIPKNSSVFRRFDNVWVPVTSTAKNQKSVRKSVDSSEMHVSESHSTTPGGSVVKSRSFHNVHPHFIGYTCGKLHEFVMKSYKSREFAAAINEVLDPWISLKQPKKEIENPIYRKSEDTRAGKRARFMVYGTDDDYEMEEETLSVQRDISFEDLLGDATCDIEKISCSVTDMGSWGLLEGHLLSRVFHFMSSDLKSLAFASLTCKHWRAAARFYKGISRQVDLSSIGPNCSDSIVWKIVNGYNREKIYSLVLLGCTNITSSMLEEIIHMFPSLSSVDVRGCCQFGELILKFPNLIWLKSRSSYSMKNSVESNSKMRSLKHIGGTTSSAYGKGLGSTIDDFGELKDYFESVDKRDSANQLFRRSLYKRTKLYDARRYSSISSRDARIRRWAVKKSENGYKRIEGFLASSIRDIMKENTFEFFMPKVAAIEERMKKGHYIRHGLNSVKDDISRMCRDAMKVKNRSGAGNMFHIVSLFIQLATRLDQAAKVTSSYERDELIKSWRDDTTAFSKYKKKFGKAGTERKLMNRSNGSLEYGDYDKEIKKRLFKLKKNFLDSGGETSDDFGQSSEDGKSESESSASETESDLDFSSEGRYRESRDGYFTADDGFDSITDDREWGARMTKASLVPPVTRKYDVIDKYLIVEDEEDVQRKMRVSLPEDYAEKLSAQKIGTEEFDLELPEVKDYKPRKLLGEEVIEQEVYGIDPYTHNLLLDSMPELGWTLLEKHVFVEDVLLRALNKQVRSFTGSGSTPMVYQLQPVLEEIRREDSDSQIKDMCQGILKAIETRPNDNYVAYRKGLGVVCNKEDGFGQDDFVVEFLGEVYPVWKWFEKQDGIRLLQKNSKDPAPEFYNIYLERPKGDADGYDLVVVDAMHKANYASRICHSCHPNCEAKVTAVDGHYQIGIYALREIQNGEEITFDYNSVTESKEEYEASVCLCGSQVCRGSYLNLTGEGAFLKVLKEWHGVLNRQQLMLEACELNFVTEEDYLDLGRAGLGSCLLGGLPDWLVAYSARLVRFINFERTKLPEEIYRHNVEEKRKYLTDVNIDVEKSDAEVQAEGVYNQRLQNLAVTLDKVRYVMRCVFGDAKKAPPPVERLKPDEVVSFIWKGEGSFVKELLQSMAPHVEEVTLNELKSKIHARNPSDYNDIQEELRKSLLWLRDEVRNLTCTYKCRHDAAADLIHIYAYTKCFFKVRPYKTVTSCPVYISPLDLGPKCADKLTGPQEYCKTYGENYCLGQLMFWYNQTSIEPDNSLIKTSRGCLSLPEAGSFYAKKPSRHPVYGPKTLRFMLSRMEKQPQKPWPIDRIWSFKNSLNVFGSPMLDAVLHNTVINRDMVHWLKHRPVTYKAEWDE